MAAEMLLLRNVNRPGSRAIETYLSAGGYQGLRRILKELTPEKFVEEVKTSGLRGRGGAGFPTGVKWGFLPKGKDKPRYLCVNADESEPGTFKDRLLIEKDPHLVLEGVIASAWAIECHTAFFYIRGEFHEGARIFEGAVQEARARGFLGKNILGSGFDLDVIVYRGAGAYICGEETALLDHVKQRLGIAEGGTTPDGRFSLEVVECLGNCDKAPAVQISERDHGPIDPAALDALLETLR